MDLHLIAGTILLSKEESYKPILFQYSNTIYLFEKAVRAVPNMFYGASPEIFEKASLLMRNQTSGERALWKRLKDGKLLGLKFRRQHPIACFVADFYCHKIRLVVEVDGSHHEKPKQQIFDTIKSEELIARGITVMRFSEQQAIHFPDQVISEMKTTARILLESNNNLDTSQSRLTFWSYDNDNSFFALNSHTTPGRGGEKVHPGNADMNEERRVS